jgi:cellulose biosynthesis protein BcsQ
MAKIISLFNHKGGVSKTTTAFHLGWKMAALGKKVLIVDADPQCNLTGLTLGLDDYEDLFKFYDSKQNTDIFNSLAPIFAINSNVTSGVMTRTVVATTDNPNLYILAGNIRFAEIDTQIATALTSSQTIPVLRRFISAINELIRRIAKEQAFDIVVIDMSPSISATNHCILMGSDYFIIPISPDFYCYQAIDSLSNVLPRWSKEIAPFREGNDEFTLPKTNPRMLGFISQNYRIYTTGEGNDDEPKTMAKAYREWIEKIKDVAARKLVPKLKEAGMIIDEALFKKNVNYDVPYHLAGVQNFSGLIPVSQKLSKPIFDLTQQDGNWAGARWKWEDKNHKTHGIMVNIQDADTVYTNLSVAVLKMIDEYQPAGSPPMTRP